MTASWTKAVLLAFAMYVPGVLAAAPPTDSAILRSFDAPDGETYLAVSLRSDDLPNSVVPHDHVILVDTSAQPRLASIASMAMPSWPPCSIACPNRIGLRSTRSTWNQWP